MKQINILTFHRAINYGAVLQCYALYTALLQMGYDVKVIDYNPKVMRKNRRLFAFSDIVSFLYSIKMLKSKLFAIRNFNNFLTTNLQIISIQNMSQTPILIASYAVIVSAIFRLAPTISRIQVNLTRLNTSRPQLIELIDFYEKYGINKFEPQESSVLGFNSTIELEDVSFSYDSKKVLDGLDFKIDKGEFIGIVGDSGAGKTTLIDILAGLLQIKTGRIIVDGKLILGTEVPRFRIGYIPQDYAVISGSIRENVAFGDVEIDDEKVVETLKKAQLYDFIVENFKEGIYAEPFVDSIGFSQGQKQRLAIARALYLDPDIIILDEATSSLDLKTEDEICEALNRLKGEKTIIAIAHRLSTIKNADKICFMKNSKIVAEGNFDELYLSNDDFKRLVDLNQSNSIH